MPAGQRRTYDELSAIIGKGMTVTLGGELYGPNRPLPNPEELDAIYKRNDLAGINDPRMQMGAMLMMSQLLGQAQQAFAPGMAGQAPPVPISPRPPGDESDPELVASSEPTKGKRGRKPRSETTAPEGEAGTPASGEAGGSKIVGDVTQVAESDEDMLPDAQKRKTDEMTGTEYGPRPVSDPGDRPIGPTRIADEGF